MPTFHRTTLYAQVVHHLRQRIHSGEWQPGHFLPNEGELARAYKVSQGTMRKALGDLEAEGLVVRQQGRGTRVTSPKLWKELSPRAKHLLEVLGADKQPTPEGKVAVKRGGGETIYNAMSFRMIEEAAAEIAICLERMKASPPKGSAGKEGSAAA